MRLGLQRAALAKLLAHAAHRRHAETGKLCDLSRVLALPVKFKNALPQGDRYGSHAPLLPEALGDFKLHYLVKCYSSCLVDACALCNQVALSIRRPSLRATFASSKALGHPQNSVSGAGICGR